MGGQWLSNGWIILLCSVKKRPYPYNWWWLMSAVIYLVDAHYMQAYFPSSYRINTQVPKHIFTKTNDKH